MHKSYGQFCPIALGAELFAERWTPLLLRELLYGARRFGEFQRGMPKISRNLLTERLGQLTRAGIVDRVPVGHGHYEYVLTPAGEALRPVVVALGAWGYEWAAHEIGEGLLDPQLLMWFQRRHVHRDQLPTEPLVVRFTFRGARPKKVFWLILERPEADLCLKDPGFDVGLDVTADLDAMTQVYLGRRSLVGAIRDGSIELAGPAAARSTLLRCLAISAFARPPSRQPPGSDLWSDP
jgi:DNA-binding HxlR family transcriptional regulator